MTRRYSFAYRSTFEGVCNANRIWRLKETVGIVRITENTTVSKSAVPTTFFSSFRRCPPNACETKIPQPWVRPEAKPITRYTVLPVAPTAARASSPKNCPTMIVSAMLYICWNRVPSKTGTEKKKMVLVGLPTVISFVLFMA